MAGKDWLASYRKRNTNLSLRKPENTSAARSFGFNKTAVNDFYQNIEKIFGKYKFTGDRIFNFDESGISTVLNTPRVLADKSQKQIGQLVSAERGELVTFGGIISASGNTIPPLFIFPRVHFKDYFLEGAPDGSLGVATRSGWINSTIFIDVLKHVQKFSLCSKENPILLLCDNHESHVTIEAVNYARENGIVYLSFPPHTTHRLQPLDVGVFGPFKAKLKIAFNDWHVSNPGKTMNIYNIPKLAKHAFFESFNAKNITKAFEKTGIWPFNKLVFSEDDFAPVKVYQSVSALNPESDVGQNIDGKILTTSSSSNFIPASDSVPSPLQNINMNMPLTSSALITPEMIRPYPKVSKDAKKKSKSGREPGKSRIYTDTPEKDRLEEIGNLKEIKKMEQERKAKAREVRRALNVLSEPVVTKPKRSRKTIEIASETESDDESAWESSSSFDELFEDSNTENEVPVSINPQNITEESFLLIKFEKKKSVTYYVGQVIEKFNSSEFKISFLRKKPGSWNFVFPTNKDEGTVDVSDIELVLPEPKSAATARTANIFSFAKDLSPYNIL